MLSEFWKGVVTTLGLELVLAILGYLLFAWAMSEGFKNG